MVGGSGLYVNAVLKGFDEFPDVAPEIRDTTQLGIGIKRLGVSSGRIKTTGPKKLRDYCATKPASRDSALSKFVEVQGSLMRLF